MKAVISPKKSAKKLPDVITKENMHLFPKDMQDFCALIEKDKNRIFAPKKYLPAQKSLVLKKIKNIYQERPIFSVSRLEMGISSSPDDRQRFLNYLDISFFNLNFYSSLSSKF